MALPGAGGGASVTREAQEIVKGLATKFVGGKCTCWECIAEAFEPVAELISAAQSWHDFHHGSDCVQCDEICEALNRLRDAAGHSK